MGKVNTTTKENAGFHQNTKKEIGRLVFVADDTLFTTRNIALTAEVGAHTRIHTILVGSVSV